MRSLRHIRNQDDLDWLKENEIQESRELEYKSQLPKKTKEEKENSKFILSKAISALVNTNGGQLIIGIKEKHDIASGINWIEKKNFRQTLDIWINSELDPPIMDYEIKAISNKSDSNLQVYVITVKRSNIGPHMANNGAFYKRIETSSIHMTKIEVMEAMLKRSLREALIVEMNSNLKRSKNMEIQDDKLHRVLEDIPSPLYQDKLQIRAAIFPFKTEAWRVVVSSGLFSVIQEQHSSLIDLYDLISDFNFLTEYPKFDIRRIQTQDEELHKNIMDVLQPLNRKIKSKLVESLRSLKEEK